MQILLPSIIYFASLALAASSTSTYTLAYEPLEATATPVPLAILVSTPPKLPTDTSKSPSAPALNPAYDLKSYSPPSAKGITPLLRIGVLQGKKLVGSTTLTTLDALSKPDEGLLKIVLDSAGEVFGASWHLNPLKTEAGGNGQRQSKNTEKGKPALLVSGNAPEPRPVLNKPVVLNEQGKIEEPEPPKTLLQRYWWVGAALLLMVLAGGGGE